MEFGFTEEQQRFRQEVRDFCEREPWGEIATEIAPDYSPTFYRKVAEKGWLGLQFPKEYGGEGKDAIYDAIFAEEVGYTGAPIGSLYSLTVFLFGNLIFKCGTEQQKKEYLPRIIRGEITAGQAFTEPEAGSDLASVQTRAVRKGDYYIINGQKMFTTYAHVQGGYSILMARTDPNAHREQGISLFILDNETPGISYTPLMSMGGSRTNQVFLDNVKIPRENLLGKENRGWDCFTQNKAYYWNKGRAYRLGRVEWMFDKVAQYAKETESNGHPLSHNSLIRQKLAEMVTDIKVMRLLTYRLAWMQSKDMDALTFAAIVKVFSDEALLRFTNSAMQILSLHGQLERGARDAPLAGVVEQAYRWDAIRHFLDSGGACVTRNFVAHHGLGLPES
jgi:hypothetical protein